jgi:hypothetical protein
MLAMRYTSFDPKRKSCLGLPTDNLHFVLHSTSCFALHKSEMGPVGSMRNYAGESVSCGTC